jgi:hypothetical protein
MKLEDQVCSLEYAQRLKELGVKQESLFYYSMCNHCAEEYKISLEETLELAQGTTHENNYSAFTVAELGEMLPDKLKIKIEKYSIKKNERYFNLVYYNFSINEFSIGIERDKEADARTEMLIYLIEKKYMEVP